MCLIVKREAKPALTMTIASILPPQNACIQVPAPVTGWSNGLAWCPNCKHKLRVSVTTADKQHPEPATPPAFTVHQSYAPFTHLPQSPLYAPAISPLPTHYNNVLTQRLSETLTALRLSGWYYGNLDWQGARTLLKDASVGAFVIRNSGDRKFYFSLSVQTERGPTSVRMHYDNDGFFRLDCDDRLAQYMPRFRCVVELVQDYTRVGRRNANGTVWVDRDGCPHSPVLLKRPLRSEPPSLLHAARLAVHKALNSNPHTPKLWCAPKHRLLPLPSSLIDYLGEYPYAI